MIDNTNAVLTAGESMEATQHKERLEQLEGVIAASLNTFFEVGRALAEIHATELYKLTHKSFDDYLRERWKFGVKRARQFIQAFEVVKALPPAMATMVANERQARAIAQVPPQRRNAVMQAAQESAEVQGRDLTIQDIAEAASDAPLEYLPPSPPPPPRPTAPPVKTAAPRDGDIIDKTGIPVPAESLELWKRADTIDLHHRIRTLISDLQSLKNNPDLLFAEITPHDWDVDILALKNIGEDLTRAIPHAICPSCQGKLPTDCTTCKGRGFVSWFYWGNFVSEDIKRLREGKEVAPCQL